MKSIIVRQIKNKKEYEAVISIRKKVFVQEQNVPVNMEFDSYDIKSKHIIVLFNDKPIGCARLRFYDNKIRLERIALLKKYRNKGFGKELLEYLIEYAKKKKIKHVAIHAQSYLKNYYKRFGFKVSGKPFKEAGIPHVMMFLELRK